MVEKLLKDYYIKNILVFSLVILTLLGAGSSFYFNYLSNKDVLYSNIDDSLKHAAYSADLILGEDFHDRAVNKDDIKHEEDNSNILKLSKLTKNIEIEYLYTLVQKDDGELYFTSSSATQEELLNDAATAYFDKYDEATPLLKSVLKNRKIVYENSTDRWGTFRTVFIPLISKNGNEYIVGADIKIDYINDTLSAYIKKMLTIELVMLVLLLMFLFYFLRATKKELHDIKSLKLELENEILSKTNELSALNDSLEITIKSEVDKNREKDNQMLKQARMAQMGEMISMIAHQWRQPLGAISSTAINLKMRLELDKYDLNNVKESAECKSYYITALDNISGFVESLTNTIDDFRNFYKPNKLSAELDIKNAATKAINIISSSFRSDNISIVEDYNSTINVNMHENEIMQVVLNILKNAQDNFKENGITNPTIKITSHDIDNGASLEISDNGGGIPQDILEKIFDPYFSTKSEKNGTGLGLYMSKTIVEEHHTGKFYAKNIDGGVCFVIEIRNSIPYVI